jgi:signal transduction histidine kinase
VSARSRLDLVIRRTLVVGALGAFVTGAYVVIVVGLGSLIDSTLALRIVATAIIALAFQPVRARANHMANRIVYGRRATPYEILARFSDRVGGTYAAEDVLPRVAHVIADGTAARADVWLRIGDTFRRAASWPDTDGAGTEEVGEIEEIAGDHVAAVVQLGEVLGAIAVSKDRAVPLTPNDAELVDRLAEQAGLVVANARLTADLEARLDDIGRQAAELRASRQRIVAAQDEERRRLERNIHDGAQQHLVALAVKLRLVRTAIARDPESGRRMLAEIHQQVDAATDTIRALSLGVYPPLLEDQGIAAALAAQYTASGLPVRLRSEGLVRYPIEIEAAVYFCILEALQNTAKYAGASTITVTVDDDDGVLRFEVADDGRGFDPSRNGAGTGLAGMRDRLAVFGGTVEVESGEGRGTVVRGRVPSGAGVLR